MTARLSFSFALVAAAVLHGAALLSWRLPEPHSADASREIASAKLASGDIAEMVAAWTSAPAVSMISPRVRAPTFESASGPAAHVDRTVRVETAKAIIAQARDAAPTRVIDAPALPAVFDAGAAPDLPRFDDIRKERAQTILASPKVDRPPQPAISPPSALLPDSTPRPVNRPDDRPERVVVKPATAASASASKAVSVQSHSEPSSSQRTAAQQAWAREIHRRIARHQSYPRRARGEGDVRLALTILRNGQLSDVRVASTSGSPVFDKAAISAVRRAAPFPAAPAPLTDNYYSVSQRLLFRQRTP